MNHWFVSFMLPFLFMAWLLLCLPMRNAVVALPLLRLRLSCGAFCVSSWCGATRHSCRGQRNAVSNNFLANFWSNLAFTQEMYPIYMEHVTGSPAEDLSLPTLASAIEQLMQNMTISFFSEPALLTNASEIKTDVVVSTYNIVYFYNWQRLALSYSAVLLLALVAMIIGLYTIFSTGQSYSNNFSTILRVAQNENLAALIEERDRKGQDPLPKHIAKARFGIETVGDGVQLRRRVGRGVGPEHETLKTQYVSASEVS